MGAALLGFKLRLTWTETAMPKGKPSAHSHPTLAQHELRRVAVAANCDPRSVVRYLRGGSMVSTSIARIERALCECGHESLARRANGAAMISASAGEPTGR